MKISRGKWRRWGPYWVAAQFSRLVLSVESCQRCTLMAYLPDPSSRSCSQVEAWSQFSRLW